MESLQVIEYDAQKNVWVQVGRFFRARSMHAAISLDAKVLGCTGKGGASDLIVLPQGIPIPIPAHPGLPL